MLSSFALKETDAMEVESMSLGSSSAPGWDNIRLKFLKFAKSTTVPIITYLANLCFNTGIILRALKNLLLRRYTRL